MVPEAPTQSTRLNVICRPELWDVAGWERAWGELELPTDSSKYHRKAFEWAHAAYGLRRLGAIGPSRTVVGVGAGHERMLYWLTNVTDRVIATDLYRGEFTSTIAEEADPEFLRDPDRFAPFAYRRDRLFALPADGLALPLRTSSVDAVYSLSSIEHFGGHTAAREAMREMCRVLKPGGIACVATELILEGGVDAEYFTMDELVEHVIRGNGMVLVEPLDDTFPSREVIDEPVWLPHVEVTPHLVLAIGALRWTSVVLFFRKPTRAELVRAWVRQAADAAGRRIRSQGR